MEMVSTIRASNAATHESSREDIQEKCLWCDGALGEPAYVDVRDRLGIVPGSWTFLRCVDCGSLNLHPRPDPDAIPKFYPKGYTVAPDGDHCPERTLMAPIRSLARKLADCLIY